MKKSVLARVLSIVVVFIMLASLNANYYLPAQASSTNLKGTEYTFDDDCDYAVSEANTKSAISGKTQFGCISIDGNISSLSDQNGVQAFEVSSGTVKINYAIDTTQNVVEDKVKKVSNASLDDKVLKGAVIVQTSLDGENWILDKYYTDVLDEDSEFDSFVYESNYVQQSNGCYFRIVIAYKTEKLVEESSVLFVDTSDYEYTRWAEVYKFYLIDKERGNAGSVNTTPRTVFQDSEYRIKTDKDCGYTGHKEEDIDDPHYGWSLGEFTINGYTAADKDDNDTPVFLKNVGDQVTLWFTLKEDINKLNNNEDLFINEDKEGWDEYFGIKKTNFRKGTLIIKQTDAEGAAKDPVIYTNYLEANVHTGADTKVRLFEEGDYELALDYEIKDTDGILDSVTNYRIFFKFKIRNSNCMIFPFDLTTQNELTDRSVAKDGFRLDYANSKYLEVFVEQKAITFNGTSYAEDTRGNKSAKDGSQYTDEGIYVISVMHDYNNSRTTDKTIYVGDSDIIKALSLNNLTVDDVNKLLAQGYKIKSDGSIVSSTGEMVEQDAPEAPIENQQTEDLSVDTVDYTNDVGHLSDENTTSEKSSNGGATVGIIIVLLLLGGGAFVFYRKKNPSIKQADSKKPEGEKTDDTNKEEEES